MCCVLLDCRYDHVFFSLQSKNKETFHKFRKIAKSRRNSNKLVCKELNFGDRMVKSVLITRLCFRPVYSKFN